MILIAGFVCICVFFAYNNLRYPLKYKEEIIEISNRFNIEPSLVASIINAESRFDKKAVSNKGAVGLMQLLPSTAKWVSNSLLKDGKNYEIEQLYSEKTNQGELFDVETNITLGTRYFLYLLTKFGNLKTALCAYNAGEGTVQNWLKNKDFSKDGITVDNIPFRETEQYVNKVEKYLKVYKKKFS